MAEEQIKDELVADIGINIDKRSLKEAMDSLNKISQSLDNVKSSTIVLENPLQGFISKIKNIKTVLLAAIPAMVDFFAFKEADNVNKLAALSTQLNVTVNDLTALQVASKNAGIGMNDAVNVIQKMRQELLSFQLGQPSAELARSLAIVNSITGKRMQLVDKGKIKDAYQLFSEIANVIASIKDPQQQAAASLQIFGTNLLPLIKNGMQDINKVSKEMNERGLFVQPQDIQQMHEFVGQVNLLQQEFSGLGRNLAIDLIPVMNKFNQLLSDKEAVKGLIDALRGLANVTYYLADGLLLVSKGFEKLKSLGDMQDKFFSSLWKNNLSTMSIPEIKNLNSSLFRPYKVFSRMASSRENLLPSSSSIHNDNSQRNSSSNSSVVNQNVTHVHLNSRKSSLSIAAYMGGVV